MHTNDGLGKACADLGDGQGRGVGSEDAVRILNDLVLKLLKGLMLQIHLLKNCLNNQIRIYGDVRKAGYDLAQKSILCSLLHLALCYSLIQRLLDLGLAAICELLLDVAKINLLNCIALSKSLRNAGSHGTCTNDCYFHLNFLLN